MVAGLFITIYITQAVLNSIGLAVPVPGVVNNSSFVPFNATGLTSAWTNNVSLLLVVPIALIGWYLLRIISGGEGE